MRKSLLILLSLLFACQPKPETIIPTWEPYDETSELEEISSNDPGSRTFKIIQSKILDKNDIWAVIGPQIRFFSEEDYQELKPLIYDQDIPTLQSHIQSGDLSYEKLTQWYLYRIVKFENDRNKSLHTIISVNPNAVAEARQKDKAKSKEDHPIFGMPVLLKDNINTEGMPTTAGAHILKDNTPPDAFIVKRIKEKGGIILGKVNLSEWAYFLCRSCPSGYSAIGGQTLNPYGRLKFGTGGSSSGSGSSMAANYAAAAVGTETSGSILSPSSANSIVGLKPTIGLLSRSGIVPISSTLDTPGPMTRSVMNNAILLSAMTGSDSADPITDSAPSQKIYWEELKSGSLKGLRLGVNKGFLQDSLYQIAVGKISDFGADTIHFDPGRLGFDGFITFLNADMKVDLPKYLSEYVSDNITARSVEDVVNYNLEDTLTRIPYGQALFDGIVAENISDEDFAKMKMEYKQNASEFFEKPLQEHQLDAILSINNFSAGQAAMAQYPCLTVPMGYQESGRPRNLTFIARPFEEDKLLKMAYAFEQATKARKSPKGYE